MREGPLSLSDVLSSSPPSSLPTSSSHTLLTAWLERLPPRYLVHAAEQVSAHRRRGGAASQRVACCTLHVAHPSACCSSDKVERVSLLLNGASFCSKPVKMHSPLAAVNLVAAFSVVRRQRSARSVKPGHLSTSALLRHDMHDACSVAAAHRLALHSNSHFSASLGERKSSCIMRTFVYTGSNQQLQLRTHLPLV